MVWRPQARELLFMSGSSWRRSPWVFAGAYFLYWNIRLTKTPAKEVARRNFKASMPYLGMIFGMVVVDMALGSGIHP